MEVREVRRCSRMFEEVSGRFGQVAPGFEDVRGGCGALRRASRGSKMIENIREGSRMFEEAVERFEDRSRMFEQVRGMFEEVSGRFEEVSPSFEDV